MQVNDLTPKEGGANWQLFDMNNFSPVLKQIEGMETAELVVPTTNVRVSIT